MNGWDISSRDYATASWSFNAFAEVSTGLSVLEKFLLTWAQMIMVNWTKNVVLFYAIIILIFLWSYHIAWTQ